MILDRKLICKKSISFIASKLKIKSFCEDINKLESPVIIAKAIVKLVYLNRIHKGEIIILKNI